MAAISLDGLLGRAKGKITIFKGLRSAATADLSDRLLISIPDMHLLEKGPNDDFLDSKPQHEQRFREFLHFLYDLKKELGDDITVIQVGDMYDLWQAKGNTNLIHEAYVETLGDLEQVAPVYVIGNHDIDLYQWYKEQGQTFNRKWRWLYPGDGKPKILFEHGFQADFANNQSSWSGVVGREITRIVGYMEYLNPDVDLILGGAWDSVSRLFGIYNEYLSPNATRPTEKDASRQHEYTKYYIERMRAYNKGDTEDHHGPADLYVTIIGHTHTARLVSRPGEGERMLYLLDCGSWVNGGHEFGVVIGNELAVCQWG